MAAKPKNRVSDLDSSLKAAIKEGATSNASTVMTSNYIIPFALFLGANNKDVGFLVVIQNLGLAIAQIPGARMAGIYSRKAIWYFSMILSRILWLLVPIVLILPGNQLAAFMIIIFIIFFLNGLRNPAWTSMMGDIVPQNIRGAYFGKRNMIAGIAGILSLMASGLIVEYLGFNWLFFLAAAIGLVSIFFFLDVTDPGMKKKFEYRHTINLDISRIKNSIRKNPDFFWFTSYMVMISFAIAIASPFYTVKMLKTLDIGYVWYAAVITIDALVAIFSQPYWGKFIDRYGDKAILAITGAAICFIPFAWIFANNIPLLILVNAFDGFVFSGFTLVTFNFLLAALPEDKKTSYIANHTFLAGIGTILGTMFGGFLAIFFEASPDPITLILFASFAIRLSTLALMPKLERGQYNTKESLDHLAVKTLLIEPARSVYYTIGYVYDVNWMYHKIRDFFSGIHRKIVYRLRIETNGRI